ncbi:hypothetical protein L0337_44600 [candidate division KSB1 bacterium]|nr:hypothetical protein [candidate division KSB1 bacterium]
MLTLKIKTLSNKWHDKDEVLLHAAFQLLVDYIEQEKSEKTINWNSTETDKKAWKEIQSLYRWWKVTRPARKSPLDDKALKRPPMRFKKIPGAESMQLVKPDKKKYAKYYQALRKDQKLEQKWHEEDQKNLHRLIEIRSFLWT